MEFMYSAKPADTELKAPARQLQQLSEPAETIKIRRKLPELAGIRQC